MWLANRVRLLKRRCDPFENSTDRFRLRITLHYIPAEGALGHGVCDEGVDDVDNLLVVDRGVLVELVGAVTVLDGVEGLGRHSEGIKKALCAADADS